MCHFPSKLEWDGGKKKVSLCNFGRDERPRSSNLNPEGFVPDSQEKTWRVLLKLGCVNTVGKMSPNWSSPVATQGGGQPL